MIGITVSMFCLITIFCITAVLGGYAIAWALTTLPLQNLLSQIGKAITGLDIAVVALKALFFGVGITVISLHYGLAIQKGYHRGSRCHFEGGRCVPLFTAWR